jgi:glycosyltransferase involved in cell wall biosynthesis
MCKMWGHSLIPDKKVKLLMNLKGLMISQTGSKDVSAFTRNVDHRVESLVKRSIDCDLFYMKDHFPIHKQTTASLFMPFWLNTFRKYDFICAHGEGAGQAMLFCRPLLRGPVIYEPHGDPRAESALERQVQSAGKITSPSLRVRIICRMATACADYVITQCNSHTEELIKEGLPPDGVGIVRNGVDLDVFHELPFPDPPEFTFAYAGGFQTWQNMDNLIEAFEKIRDPNIRLLMVGFAKEDVAIKQEFAAKFGQRVKLVDKTDQASLVNMLRSVACFVIPRIKHPALSHAFPTKFIEYASLGRPTMVNDVDETADFVRKYDCGFVSDPSPEAMAKTMEHIASLPVKTLSEMGTRARRMAEENFSWEQIGDDYAELVRSVVARFRGEARL